MREIKFRAWRNSEEKFEKEMVYFELLDNDENYVMGGFIRDKDPIMQFTGLKDKNGKEIYEGDVRNGVQEVTIVKMPEIYERNPEYFTSNEDMIREEKWEVIGNIYENPELLKEVK